MDEQLAGLRQTAGPGITDRDFTALAFPWYLYRFAGAGDLHAYRLFACRQGIVCRLCPTGSVIHWTALIFGVLLSWCVPITDDRVISLRTPIWLACLFCAGKAQPVRAVDLPLARHYRRGLWYCRALPDGRDERTRAYSGAGACCRLASLPIGSALRHRYRASMLPQTNNKRDNPMRGGTGRWLAAERLLRWADADAEQVRMGGLALGDMVW